MLEAFPIANSVPVFSATLCALANLCFQNYGNKKAHACFTGPRTLSCQLQRRWLTLSVALAGSGWRAAVHARQPSECGAATDGVPTRRPSDMPSVGGKSTDDGTAH